MNKPDLSYHEKLAIVADADVKYVIDKDTSYAGSWKSRGGVGAFMMLARKWDRLENILKMGHYKYDIFDAISTESDPGKDGTVLAEVRDLRRYLLLVEAYLMHSAPQTSGTPEDGGQHSRYDPYERVVAARAARDVIIAHRKVVCKRHFNENYDLGNAHDDELELIEKELAAATEALNKALESANGEGR